MSASFDAIHDLLRRLLHRHEFNLESVYTMSDPHYESLLYERRGPVALLTLNRPKRMNAMGEVMKAELPEAFRLIQADDEVRVVVITGAGAAFCSGGDVKEMSESKSTGVKRSIKEKTQPARDEALLAIYESSKPVIAAVNGAAAGAGMNLALAADIRLASTVAHFSQAFVKRGLPPDTGGTYLLPRIVGITIKPAKTMYDGSFANVFYDDVRLPADAIIGKMNDGWKVLTSALATERGLIGGGIVCKVMRQFEQLCDFLKNAKLNGAPFNDEVLVRDKVATLAADIEVARQLMIECARLAASDGLTPPEYGAMSKVFSGELMERFGETALDIIGMKATLSQGADGNLCNGGFEQALRHSLMWVISIGTNEIQRSLIAQRGLNLPK